MKALGLNLGEQEDPLDFSSMLFTRILYDEARDGKRCATADKFEFKYRSITHSSFLPEAGSSTDAVMTHLVLSDYAPRCGFSLHRNCMIVIFVSIVQFA